MFGAEILLSILIGLVIFLFGIENFSSEIQRAAGERFKNLLHKATNNKYKSTIFGAVVTAILNSSTATTLITVGLINAGLISFAQSLGIIFGAHIGSTITSQLIALKLTSFAPYVMIIGFFLSFPKKTKFIGKALFFFGMVFFGLSLISNAVSPIANNPETIKYFVVLSSIPLAILIGFLFTTVVNSSALTMGLVIILSSSGLIDLTQGIPLILGANIGTTVTTLIASSKMNLYAKRASIAHLMFSVIGVIFMLPFIQLYAEFISSLGGTIEQQIANAHTIFNVLSAIVFLILINPFRRFVESLVRGNEEEILLSPKYIKEKIPKDNANAIEIVENEIKNFIETDFKMFYYIKKPMKEIKEKELKNIEKLFILTKILAKKIEGAIFKISERKLNNLEAEKVLYLVRMSNSLEQLGNLTKRLSEVSIKLTKNDLTLDKDRSTKELEEVYSKLVDSLRILRECFPRENYTQSKKILPSKALNKIINRIYMSRIKILKKESYSSGSIFVETISLIESSIFKIRELLHLYEKYYSLRQSGNKDLNKIKNLKKHGKK